MAAFYGQLTTASIALTAATAKTVVQIVAATNHRVRIKSWGVYFDGASATAIPVVVRLVRQTDAGTSSALTPLKRDDSIADTLLTTGRHTATVEPTTTDLLEAKLVHPQGGYERAYGPGDEVIVGGGDRVGIECTAPAGVNVRAEIIFEE